VWFYQKGSKVSLLYSGTAFGKLLISPVTGASLYSENELWDYCSVTFRALHSN
jgi:uncharacterized membrane protein (UPF0136 family)